MTNQFRALPRPTAPQLQIPSSTNDFDEDEQRREGNSIRRRAPSRSTSLLSVAQPKTGKIRLNPDGNDMKKALLKTFNVSI